MTPNVIDSIFVTIFGVVFFVGLGASVRYYDRADAETKAFVRLQFDKILITILLLFSFFLLTHNLKHYGALDSVINQTWGVISFFLGLLSGLITGKSTGERASDKLKGGSLDAPKTIDSKVTTTEVTTAHIDPVPPAV